MTELEIFYDIISPYSYLGLELFKRHELFQKCRVTLTPVSLGTVLGATGNPGPANIAPKRRVALLDVCLQSRKHDVIIKGPPAHPFIPLIPMRFIHSIEDLALRFETALVLNRECWAFSCRMDREEDIFTALQKHNQMRDEWQDISAFIRNNNGRGKLKQATKRAVELDVFGVPTFRYKGINFWGSDRLELLNDYLSNEDFFKDTHYERMLNLPSGL